MLLRIENLPEKKFIGKHLETSLAENRTFELWRSFMPFRKEIKNRAGNRLFSIQVFKKTLDFNQFNKNLVFQKWAAVEVKAFDQPIPEGMDKYVINGGLYAVFIHKGVHATFGKTFEYIFKYWLPGSGYVLDGREHFEIMEEGYSTTDPNAEEEIWLPVKLK